MYALRQGSEKDLLLFLQAGFVRVLWYYQSLFRYFDLGIVHIPRHSGSFAVVLLFSATGVFGMYAGGHAGGVSGVIASITGFAVERVLINGHHQTSEIDILDALELDGRTSMIGLDINHVREVISSFPWVCSVSVRKIYPDQLHIAIVERVPAAIWQHDGIVDIIDREGHVIMPYSGSSRPGLPLLVGVGAGRHAAVFLDGIKSVSAIADRARAYIRVGDRRWDILLDNGVCIKLPELNESARLAEALVIEKEVGLFSRDVEIVDLRLDGRITVTLSREAMARRMAVVKELEHRGKTRKAGQV